MDDRLTEHPTREGKIYCCAVIDAFSRMVVGWSIDSRQTGLLVANALGIALNRRTSREGGIIHSDQGVQFGSWAFSQKVTQAGLAPSVGAVGAPFDNAMVEAFWARMPQRPEHAYTQRIRDSTPHKQNRRLIPDWRLHETRVRSRPPRFPERFTLIRNRRRSLLITQAVPRPPSARPG